MDFRPARDLPSDIFEFHLAEQEAAALSAEAEASAAARQKARLKRKAAIVGKLAAGETRGRGEVAGH